jgi:glycosyltransferase involved in cell wall biosynthesis
MNKRVSLLVPLSTGSTRYLAGLRDGIAQQTRPFDEIIMYDDLSSDRAFEVARQFGFEVTRGTIRRGPAGARNELLKAATGDIVHFHDHDDPLHPEFLERMLPHTVSNGFSACWFNKIDNGKTLIHKYPLTAEANPYELVFSSYVHVNAMLIDRALAMRSGGFDEELTLCEEKFFLFCLINVGGIPKLVPEALAEWRLQDTSTMHSQGWVGAAEMLRKFVLKCADRNHPAKDKMLEYALRASWDYYYADENALTDINLMFKELAARGLYPVGGLGRKIGLLAKLVGPTLALRLRRLIATQRPGERR